MLQIFIEISHFYRSVTPGSEPINLDPARVSLENKVQILFVTKLGSSSEKAT